MGTTPFPPGRTDQGWDWRGDKHCSVSHNSHLALMSCRWQMLKQYFSDQGENSFNNQSGWTCFFSKNHVEKKAREVAPALPYPEVKAIMEMPGAAVVLIVRHPFTRSVLLWCLFNSLDLVLLQVKFISKMPGYSWCAFCLIVFHLQLSKKVFVASRLISAFRDKLERQTPGNAYLERWILSWEVIFILIGDFYLER